MPDLRNGSLRWLALSALIIALDLLSKWFADTNLQMYQQVPIIDGLFSFTLAYNPGAAFTAAARQDHGAAGAGADSRWSAGQSV